MDFTEIERIRGTWADTAAAGLLSVGVAVRGPARSSPAVYRREWELAGSLGLRIAMHCAGTRAEVAQIRQVDLLAADGLLDSDLLLAHGNHLTADDLALLAEWRIPVSVSPLSELRLAMGFPQISEMLAAGVPVALSLDTTAISANADMFQTMRVAVGLENARLGDAQALSPRRALELAMIDGARALGLNGVTGSLSPGKRADFILVRTDRLSMTPVVDPAVALVHSAAPADVDTVVVDGRILKRQGRLTAIDPAVAVAEAQEALSDPCARAGFVPVARPT